MIRILKGQLPKYSYRTCILGVCPWQDRNIEHCYFFSPNFQKYPYYHLHSSFFFSFVSVSSFSIWKFPENYITSHDHKALSFLMFFNTVMISLHFYWLDSFSKTLLYPFLRSDLRQFFSNLNLAAVTTENQGLLTY